MKVAAIVVMVCFLTLGSGLIGCSQQKADSSSAAIQAAKAMETAEQKVDYLIGQAKSFYNSKEFQNAIDTAQYILTQLDKDSQTAKSLLEKAKDALAAKAKEAVDSATEGMSKKIGNFGN